MSFIAHALDFVSWLRKQDFYKEGRRKIFYNSITAMNFGGLKYNYKVQNVIISKSQWNVNHLPVHFWIFLRKTEVIYSTNNIFSRG